MRLGLDVPRHDARGDEVMSECENGAKRREVKTSEFFTEKNRMGERGTGRIKLKGLC